MHPSDLIKNFGSIVLPVNTRISINLKQNQELATLRDWLLPMLMNGQVTVGSVSREQEGKTYENDFAVGIAAEGERNMNKK